MKTLNQIAEWSPLRESLPSDSVLRDALWLCRDTVGRIEPLHPVKQHFALERAEKHIHHTRATGSDLAAQTAYSLLFQYHSLLLGEQFGAFTDAFNHIAWTRDFDINYFGGKTAFDAPKTHHVDADGFNRVAEHHYLRAARDWAPIERSHQDRGACPMAYRYSRNAVINFHLYRLGLERQECNAQYFANAIASVCKAGEITVPWSKDFWQVKQTLEELDSWMRTNRVPQREDYLRALDTIKGRLNELHLRQNPAAQPPSPE
jgi:hypothetical protein